MMKSRLLGGVIMEGGKQSQPQSQNQTQHIKEESHSPSSNSPRSRTTPTPPITTSTSGVSHLPSGKENRIISGSGSNTGINSNGRSGCNSPATATTTGAVGTTLNKNNLTDSPGTASLHPAQLAHGGPQSIGLTNTEILTRSRSKGMHKEGHTHSGRGERDRSGDRSPKGHSRHHSHRDRPTDRDRSLSPLVPVPVSQTSINLSIPRSSSTPTYAHSHGGHSHYSPHIGTPIIGLSNGRRTPSPSHPQPHHQQQLSSNSSSSSANRTPSSISTTAVSASSSGSSSGGSVGNSRLLIKIKRFLGTLLQFGADISPEIGDRVRALVFSLVSGHVSIEEFHGGLQEVTSFPLRPFVLPFLRAHLPLLQREVGALARSSKAASTLAFIQTHESSIIDPAAGEPCDIFHSEASDLSLSSGSGGSSSNNKRKVESLYENGDGSSDHQGYTSTPKRHHGGGISNNSYFSSPPSSFFPELREYYAAAAVAASSAAYGTLPLSLTNSSQSHTHTNDRGGSTTPMTNGLSTPKPAAEDEWKNIHTMLNCILSMVWGQVEKTKRALGILQSRAASDVGNGDACGGATWLRRPGGVTSTGMGGPFILDNSEELKRQVGEMMAQAFRATEDRVCEVKRRAEEAVQEVKRQALAELKRAVAAAESRACEAVAGERARLERVLLESRGNGGGQGSTTSTTSQQLHPPLPPPPPAQSEAEACWNCGRKAHETCSGCNTARYCSSFCQHKDWESHHAVCKASGSTSIATSASVAHVNCSSAGTIGSGGGNRSTSPGNSTGHSHPSPTEGSRSPRSTSSNHSN